MTVAALKRALRPGGGSTGLIKGQASSVPKPGLFPGFSASGQDVWLPKATHFGPGLVLSAVGARCGKVFVADGAWSVVANTVVLTPQPGHDPKFLWYVVNNEGFWEKGGTAQPYVRVPETLARHVWLPPLAEQRAIADYLDAETARIDALIAKKQQLIHLLEERRWRFFEKRVQESCGPVVPLRRAVEFLTDGPFGSAFSSAEYVEGGLGVVRLGNIGFVEFKDDDIAFLPLERWDEFRRYTVREGDLLVAGLGDPKNHAGRVCVAPDYGPLIVKGKCFCARVNKEMATPEFLAMSCSSPASAERFGLSAQGSTRQMINLSIFREHEITLPSVHSQREIVKATENEWRRSDHIAANLESQINLLSERRQALITAAVTGEFAVAGLMEKHR